jgi:ribosomal protein L11 methylase PrmA
LIANLEAAVRKLLSPTAKSQWSDYYDDIHYSQQALLHKSALISEFLEIIRPKTLWDLGANTGFFSRLASEQGIMTISFDSDHGAVEKNYAAICEHNETNLLPIVLDLTNPTSRFGWANEERLSFLDRGPVDAVFALALMHHLCISNNVPLDKLSHFFSRLSSWLVIEFVPKSDNQVQKLLSSRVDIFPDYNQESFLKAFSAHFENIREENISDTERYLYLLRRKTS